VRRALRVPVGVTLGTGTGIVTAALSAALLAACGQGENAPSGLGEPLRVRNGQFRQEPLPRGTTPATPDGGAPDGGAPEGVAVTAIDSQNNIIYQGQQGKRIAGHATLGAPAVAVAFEGMGTGYWTVPVDVADPQLPGQATWDVLCDFSPDLLPGLHALRFLAIDANGRPGGDQRLKVCVPSPTEGLRACDPKKKLPGAVVELTWDAPVDLDLRLETPEGKIVGGKSPTTAAQSADGGVAFDPATDGVLDRDSNANCDIDGAQREEISWASYPRKGTYRLRVNLYSSCGLPAVRFKLRVLVARGEDDAREQVEKLSIAGELIELNEDAINQTGLFVSDFIF
jgi:hypothetical protein